MNDCDFIERADATAQAFITDCLCDAGYELHDSEHRCVACQPGYYATKGSNVCQPCPDNTFSEGTASSCTPCAAHGRSPVASESQAYCNCKPGFGSRDSVSCTVCTQGFDSPGGVAETNQYPACIQCPSQKTSADNSDAIDDCVCVPGHEDIGSDASAPCTACINGQYSTGGANQPCELCGFGAISQPSVAATSFENCQCNALLGLQPVV